MVLNTRPPKLRIKALQEETAYDAADLNGVYHMATENNSVWIWFTSDSYDGTVYFEVSPDGGTVWFPVQGFQIDNAATLVTSVASPVDDESYIVRVPSHSLLRIRMEGGSAGTLTVYARNVEWPY